MKDADATEETLSPTQQKLFAALQARLSREPDSVRAGLENGADGEIEEQLIAIWRRVLGRNDIGRHDNYFQLGGDSVKSIQIVSQAQRLGLTLTTRKLLESPTIALLARGLHPGGPGKPTGADPGLPGLSGRFALTPLQAGLLYETLASPERHLYQSCIVLDARGALDMGLVRLAWNKVLLSHPALRTRFVWSEPGEPQQIVAAQIPCQVLEGERADLPAEEACDRLKRQMAAEVGRLDQAPLCRIGVIHLTSARHRLILVHHHLILDGWSQQLVLSDLISTYFNYLDGHEIETLPSPPFQAFVERVCLPRSVATRFWAHYLRDYRPANVLTRPGEERTTRVTRIDLDEATAAGLARLALDAGVTLSTLFQGLWALTVAEASGSTDIVYGLVVSGRDTSFAGAEDLTRVVGMCVNTVPVRVSVPAIGGLEEWLQGLRTNILDVMPHQYTPLPELKHQIVGAATPWLFETLVVIENLPGVPFHDDRLSLTLHSYEIEEGWPIVIVLHTGDAPAIELRIQPGRTRAGLPQWLEHYLRVALRALSTTPPDSLMPALRAALAAEMHAASFPSGELSGSRRETA